AAGEQTGVIDPDGHASHEYYDGAGLVTLTVDRDGRGIASYYDAAGNLTATVWKDATGTRPGQRPAVSRANGFRTDDRSRPRPRR
ncbi:MAG TPA: hypothetical protein VH092_09075, partial [Urbifossiella sp.]|nr:hypothetical protein [Urbifossiella sp.]